VTTTLDGIKRGSRKASWTVGSRGLITRQYITSYIVTSDDGTDDEKDALNTSGIPLFGATWTGDNGSTDTKSMVRRKEVVDHDATRKLWVIECEWSSESDQAAGENPSGDDEPTDWDPEIEWDTESIEIVPTLDNNKNLIVNYAGDPFTEPPITKTIHLPVLRYSRWELNFSAQTQLDYSGKVNKDVYLGFPIGSAMMRGIKSNKRFVGGLPFWWTTYSVIFAPQLQSPAGWHRAWRKKSLQRGPNVLTDAGLKVSAQIHRGVASINLKPGGFEETGDAREAEWDVYDEIEFNPLIG